MAQPQSNLWHVALHSGVLQAHLGVSSIACSVAFILAIALGIPIGVLMGWSRFFRGLTFPMLEILRPIPILAWIPLAILLLPGRETPIIGLTFLAAFFVTMLNTLLGVKSIDEVYFRAARSLGFSESAILLHVVVPGALPYIFVGLQIAMGACWFSLVASEIISGQAGLGYKVWETYYYVQYETMVIVMATLGFARLSLERAGAHRRQPADALARADAGGAYGSRTGPGRHTFDPTRRKGL